VTFAQTGLKALTTIVEGYATWTGSYDSPSDSTSSLSFSFRSPEGKYF